MCLCLCVYCLEGNDTSNVHTIEVPKDIADRGIRRNVIAFQIKYPIEVVKQPRINYYIITL